MPEIPLTPATTSRVPLPNAISLSPAALQSVGPVAWDSSLVFAAIDEEDREAPRLSRHSHVIEQCRTWSSERKPAMRRIAGLLVAMAMVGLAVPGAGANAPPTCFGKPASRRTQSRSRTVGCCDHPSPSSAARCGAVASQTAVVATAERTTCGHKFRRAAVVRCSGCNRPVEDALLCPDCMASESSGHAERVRTILERYEANRSAKT